MNLKEKIEADKARANDGKRLREYVEAFKKRDSRGRLYIRILNGDIPKGAEREKECIERIVNAWVNAELLPQDVLDRLNARGPAVTKDEFYPDFSVHKIGNRRGGRSFIPYWELYEDIIHWDSGRKERFRPRKCEECSKWFVPAPRGRIGLYCSRECDNAASNRKNAESIKAKVREGREKAYFD